MKLYCKFFAMHLKSRMAYKKSFFLTLIGQFLTAFTSFLAMWFLLQRFDTVRSYTISECLLCAGVVLTSFSLAECFFRGFDVFDRYVREAQFDRILLRPMSPMFQVLCQNIEFARLGKLIQGLWMLFYGILAAPVIWSPYKVFVLVIMILSGMLVFAGLFIIYASLCFFTLEGLECINIFIYGAKEYGVYPLDVYGKPLLRFCTLIIPYALFEYYPLLYLLGRISHPLYGLTPLLAPLFLIPCILLWRFGISRYTSAG